MKENAELYGQMAASLKPEQIESFMINCKKRAEVSMNETKEQDRGKMPRLEKKQAQLENDLNMRGYMPEIIAKESIVRGIFMLILLIVATAGEAVFAFWMLEPFQLGQKATAILTAAFIVICWEGFDIYLVFLRRSYPEKENQLFLILGSTCFLLIVTITALGAELRQGLYETTQVLPSATSMEESVKTAENFYKHMSSSFTWFMLALSGAVVLVSGYSYHDLKHRMLMALGYLQLHRAINKTGEELVQIHEKEIELNAKHASFEADFNHGLVMKQHKIDEISKGNSLVGQIQRNVSQNFGFIIASPIFLVLLILIIFLMLRGTAKAETLIFLDLSRSSDAVDYSGKESEFQKNIKGIETYIQNYLIPGEKIRVIGITERSFSTPYTLVNTTVTTNKGYFNEIISRDKMRILKLFRSTNIKATATMTDIFGAVQLASVIFSPTDSNKKLIFLSDMRQYTQDLDLENMNVIDIDSAMKNVISKGLVPSLEGVAVSCLGVHSSQKTPAYWGSLKKFWSQYFRQAKANEPILFIMERSF